MNKNIFSFLVLFLLSATMAAQVPFAFRYQASVRDEKNRPINEELRFDIQLFSDANGTQEIYGESHIIEPDTNGLVAFSIGEGVTTDDFSTIVWAEGPYFIQVLLDNEEISYSQLVSVPYAMHAETAGKLHDLQNPVLANDPTTKSYVDQSLDSRIDSTTLSIDNALDESKAYADSLAITPKDLDVASSGDTLVIGNTKVLIPGMSSDNMEKYSNQLLLGGSYNEELIKTLQCQDGGILLLGVTNSANGDVEDFKGDADIWLVKLTSSLDISWTRTLGGSRYDNGLLLLEEADGFLVAGTTESNDGDISTQNGEFDIWLVKVDASGSIQWENTYGGAGTEFINAIIPKDDGGYYVGATTFSNGGDVSYLNGESDIWVFELNDRQEIINNKNIGGTQYDALTSMELSDNNLILYGTSSSNDGDILANNGALDFISITLDQDLEIIKQECFGDTGNEQLEIATTTNDGVLLAGNIFAENWSISAGSILKNIYLKKLGSTSWDAQFGGGNNEILVDLVITNDTITIIAQSSSQDGDISESKGGADIWVFQLSPEGEMIKNKNIGGTYDESPKIIKPLPNGEWLIGGTSESLDGDLSNNSGEKDVWLIKLNANLDITWQKSYGGSYNESISDILIVNEKDVIVCGTTSSNDYSIIGLHDKEGKSNDIWTLQTTIE